MLKGLPTVKTSALVGVQVTILIQTFLCKQMVGGDF